MGDFQKPRNYAVFESTFPDDQGEVDGDVVTPGGQGILQAVQVALGRNGVVASPPGQHSHYGWASDFMIGKIPIWFMIQQPDPWLLIVETQTWWFTCRKVKRQALQTGLELLDRAIRAIPQLSSLAWMTRREYEEHSWRKK